MCATVPTGRQWESLHLTTGWGRVEKSCGHLTVDEGHFTARGGGGRSGSQGRLALWTVLKNRGPREE